MPQNQKQMHRRRVRPLDSTERSQLLYSQHQSGGATGTFMSRPIEVLLADCGLHPIGMDDKSTSTLNSSITPFIINDSNYLPLRHSADIDAKLDISEDTTDVMRDEDNGPSRTPLQRSRSPSSIRRQLVNDTISLVKHHIVPMRDYVVKWPESPLTQVLLQHCISGGSGEDRGSGRIGVLGPKSSGVANGSALSLQSKGDIIRVPQMYFVFAPKRDIMIKEEKEDVRFRLNAPPGVYNRRYQQRLADLMDMRVILNTAPVSTTPVLTLAEVSVLQRFHNHIHVEENNEGKPNRNGHPELPPLLLCFSTSVDQYHVSSPSGGTSRSPPRTVPLFTLTDEMITDVYLHSLSEGEGINLRLGDTPNDCPMITLASEVIVRKWERMIEIMEVLAHEALLNELLEMYIFAVEEEKEDSGVVLLGEKKSHSTDAQDEDTSSRKCDNAWHPFKHHRFFSKSLGEVVSMEVVEAYLHHISDNQQQSWVGARGTRDPLYTTFENVLMTPSESPYEETSDVDGRCMERGATKKTLWYSPVLVHQTWLRWRGQRPPIINPTKSDLNPSETSKEDTTYIEDGYSADPLHPWGMPVIPQFVEAMPSDDFFMPVEPWIKLSRKVLDFRREMMKKNTHANRVFRMRLRDISKLGKRPVKCSVSRVKGLTTDGSLDEAHSTPYPSSIKDDDSNPDGDDEDSDVSDSSTAHPWYFPLTRLLQHHTASPVLNGQGGLSMDIKRGKRSRQGVRAESKNIDMNVVSSSWLPFKTDQGPQTSSRTGSTVFDQRWTPHLSHRYPEVMNGVYSILSSRLNQLNHISESHGAYADGVSHMSNDKDIIEYHDIVRDTNTAVGTIHATLEKEYQR